MRANFLFTIDKLEYAMPSYATRPDMNRFSRANRHHPLNIIGFYRSPRRTHIPDRAHMPCFYIERPAKRIFLIKHVCHIRPAAEPAIDGRSPWTPSSSSSAKPYRQAREPRRLRAMTTARPVDQAHGKLTINQGLFGHSPSIIAAS
ncbi:hypothetical protein [Streptosporangium sp. 'caverna']|uniref:hypothetical protein n=1 Tax=Streptosporangium sp. 'caverna' TaxID=2202249 RepID=UPI0013A6D5EB|nr:hypothetical protein [Streptosporangium sp. 'caverna']